MPKELVHWWLAAAALQCLPSNSPTRNLLEEHRQSYLVGATLPDTLLHLLRGPHSATALHLADAFHNTNKNSYAPLLQFVDGPRGTGCESRDTTNPCHVSLTPAVRACLLGVATHMEADIVFHPFVYAQAGNDLSHHYRVETELDLWLLRHNHPPPCLLLKDLVTTETAPAATAVMAGVFDPTGTLPVEAFDSALKAHCRIQALYSSPFWQLTAYLLGLLPGTPIRAWRWLFYPPGWRNGRDIHWPEHWTEPASGRMRTATPADLLTTSVARISTLLEAVDELGLVCALRVQQGENLLTGFPPSG